MTPRYRACTGCDARLPAYLTLCAGCLANGGRPADPYADLDASYREQIAPPDPFCRVTQRTPTAP